MGEQPKKRICAGLLAHVDAGKTTLSEALLYTAGAIPTLGRVDHRDAYLDTHDLERARGITIFSKQAVLPPGGTWRSPCWTPRATWTSPRRWSAPSRCWTTPSWSSAAPTASRPTPETLWRLLERYHVPTFLFVNKMDLAGAGAGGPAGRPAEGGWTRAAWTSPPRTRPGPRRRPSATRAVLERYLETGTLCRRDRVRPHPPGGRLFPCFFGSALQLEGVEDFLQGLETVCTAAPAYGRRPSAPGSSRSPGTTRATA